jgi:hypothetical protein
MPGRGFNVGVFRAAITERDLLRPNRFLIEFTIPLGLFGIGEFDETVQTVRTLEYWCEGLSIPSFALATYPNLRYGYGAMEKRPFMGQFDTITCAVINDGKAANFNFFYSWINMIHNNNMSQGPFAVPNTVTAVNDANQPRAVGQFPYELSYKKEYATDVKIRVYDNQGNERKTICLREAFPMMLGEMQLNWADNQSYLRLPVSLTFTDWYTEVPVDVAPGA